MAKFVISEAWIKMGDGKYHKVQPMDFDAMYTPDTVKSGKGNINNYLHCLNKNYLTIDDICAIMNYNVKRR